jgi:pyridoxal phosphate-dependent aminotransferase EpsN
MSKKRMYLSPPDLSGRELEYVQQAFASNWIAPFGPAIEQLKIELCKKTGASHAEPVNSGTSALHLALMAAGIKDGDIIFCPSFTFAASVFPIVYQRAIPVFIDSEPETWNMDPDILEEAILDSIRERQKPKAIVVVHIYGFPAQLKKILAIAAKYELILIEDAAESMGSTLDGTHTGRFGTFGIFSFNGNKIVTGSSGGAVITNDSIACERISRLANQAKEDKPYYEHSEIGYNYRLSNINAAIALAQLEQLEQKIERKKYIRAQYTTLLKGFAEVKHSSIGVDNAWLTCILLPLGCDPERVRLLLEEHNMESRRLWNPMQEQPVFKYNKSYLNGTSNDLFNRGLCLPSGTALLPEDIIHITDIMKSSL